MFATNSFAQRSDHPLAAAAPLLAALAAGKTPAEARAAGASIPPWLFISDPFIYLDAGSRRAAQRLMSIAVAAAIGGHFDILDGMSSRSDFFDDAPLHDMREPIHHGHASIPMACALEAMARGRLDILHMLEAKARAAHALGAASDTGRHGRALLELGDSDRERLLRRLSHAHGLAPSQLTQGYAWVLKLSSASARRRLPADWLAIACESGNSAAAMAAVSLGAIPLRSHVHSAAQRGALDAAAALAPLADEALPPRAPAKAPSVAELMAESYASSIDAIAKGATEWRDPSDPSRESTWADYSDHRDPIHRACLMGLAGAFDSTGDEPSALAGAKARLASLARALCSLAQPGDEDRLAQIQAALPGAKPLAEELSLLARVGSARLPGALAQTSPGQAARFAATLTKAHADAASASASPMARRHGAERAKWRADHLDHLEAALWACFEIQRDLFDHATRDSFQSYLANAGLATRFERQALEAASALPPKRRTPLKA